MQETNEQILKAIFNAVFELEEGVDVTNFYEEFPKSTPQSFKLLFRYFFPLRDILQFVVNKINKKKDPGNALFGNTFYQ